jgi:hypothetical protein
MNANGDHSEKSPCRQSSLGARGRKGSSDCSEGQSSQWKNEKRRMKKQSPYSTWKDRGGKERLGIGGRQNSDGPAFPSQPSPVIDLEGVRAA